MKSKQVTAILLALGLILTACGGGGDKAQPQTQEPAQETTAAEETKEPDAAQAATSSDETSADATETAATSGEATADTADVSGEAATSDAAAAESPTPDDAASENEYPNKTITSDGKVDLLIPASYVAGSPEESLQGFADRYGIESVTMNDDGSATFHMTQEVHAAMLASMEEELEGLISEIKSSEDVIGVESVDHDSRYTQFTVTKSSKEFGGYEEMYITMYCGMAGQYYNLYAGSPIDSVHIDWVYAEDGEVLKSVDTDETPSEESYYTPEEQALIDNLTVNEDFSFTVVDNDDIKFEFTDMVYDGSYFYTWRYHIENKTDQALTFMSDSVCINGIHCDPYLYQKLDPGTELDGDMNWTISGLAEAGLTDVTVVDFGLAAQVSYNNYVYRERTTIYPIGEDKARMEFYTPVEGEDEVILDTDLVKAVVLGYEQNEYYDLEIHLYLENKSPDQSISFNAKNVTVGGVAIDPYWSQTVLPGKGCYRDMTFLGGSFASNDADPSGGIEFDMELRDGESYFGPAIATEHITITPKLG